MDQCFHQFGAILNYYTFFPIFFSFLLLVTSASLVTGTLDFLVVSCYPTYSLGQNSLGQNTGEGSLSLLQGIFPIQGSNPGLPHCRQILYQLNHKRSPRMLEWVAYPFSSGSSWPRSQTGVSCIAGRFFTNRAIRGRSRETTNQEAIAMIPTTDLDSTCWDCDNWLDLDIF